MSGGIVVPVMPYTVFNFAQLLNPSTEDVIVADRIPIAPFAKIGLSLRQHRKNIATGGTFQFTLRAINPSDEDGSDFVVTASFIGQTSTITAGTAGAALLEFSGGLVTNGPHPMARLILTCTGSTSAGLLYGIFSADLVMRTSS